VYDDTALLRLIGANLEVRDAAMALVF